VLLPFEQVLWASHGYDARYVGHRRSTLRAGRSLIRARECRSPYCAEAAMMKCGGSAPFSSKQRRCFWIDTRVGQGKALLSPALSEARRLDLEKIVRGAGLTCAVADPIEGSSGDVARARDRVVHFGPQRVLRPR